MYSHDSEAELEGLTLKTPIKGKFTLMNLDDAISVQFEDINLSVEMECERCLKAYSEKIKIPSADRIFELEAPVDIEDPNDIFLIDRKTFEIDLTEPLRQEIILHFPAIPVCSSGCQGICPLCGTNRNSKKCDCQEEKAEEHKPLAALKDLFKDQ